MKARETIKGTLEFHHASKDDRIIKSEFAMCDDVIKRVVVSRGIYDKDSKHIQRYAKAIQKQHRDGVVLVTKG